MLYVDRLSLDSCGRFLDDGGCWHSFLTCRTPPSDDLHWQMPEAVGHLTVITLKVDYQQTLVGLRSEAW